VSEQIFNVTFNKWAIQCHSRWYMLENTGQKTKLKPDATKNKHNPGKANNAKQNYPGSVAIL